MEEPHMIAEDHTVVTLAYELYQDDRNGELLEVMNVKYPFEFLMGNGNLLPAFEDHLRGKKEGDSFAFTLRPEQAYGPVIEQNKHKLPAKIFEVEGAIPDGLLVPGNTLAVTDDHGHKHHGTVIGRTESGEILMDFNHAMAGKTLFFTGVILRIRKATVDELVRKHHIPDDGAHQRW